LISVDELTTLPEEPAPTIDKIVSSYGGEVVAANEDVVEDDEDSTTGEGYYFLLPSDFESSTTTATTRSHQEEEEEADAVSFDYSESTVVGEEWCDEEDEGCVGGNQDFSDDEVEDMDWEPICEEFNESFDVPPAPANVPSFD
jgi:hypothetical protein